MGVQAIEHIEPQYYAHEAECQRCDHKGRVVDGFIWWDWVQYPNEPIEYDALWFCSLSCLLHTVHTRGNA